MMPYIYSSNMSRWDCIILIVIMIIFSLFDSWGFSVFLERLYKRFENKISTEEVSKMQNDYPYPIPENPDIADKSSQGSDIFALADKLRNLREERDGFKGMLKDIETEINTVEYDLAEAMTNAECPNFTRNDKQFIMTTTTRWSAETARKEELYKVLKDNGYDHLFTVNAQTLGSFVKEQIAETADDNGETHVPDWLLGLVKSYDDVGITLKSVTKKTKS